MAAGGPVKYHAPARRAVVQEGFSWTASCSLLFSCVQQTFICSALISIRQGLGKAPHALPKGHFFLHCKTDGALPIRHPVREPRKRKNDSTLKRLNHSSIRPSSVLYPRLFRSLNFPLDNTSSNAQISIVSRYLRVMMFYISITALCVIAVWSAYQAIYGLIRGKVRKFSRSATSGSSWISFSRWPDSGYCMRAAEPRWFWYHIVVYVLQGALALTLPVFALFRILHSVGR